MEAPVREAQSVKKRDEEIYQGSCDLPRALEGRANSRIDEQSPFWAIEKGAVLQEARCFNDTQLSARKCQQVRPEVHFFSWLNPFLLGDYKATVSL